MRKERLPWIFAIVLAVILAVSTTFYITEVNRLNAALTHELLQPRTHIIELKAYQWGFEPNTVMIRKGDTLIIRITSTLDQDPIYTGHGITINEYNIQAELPKGTMTELRFYGDKTGVYHFLCSTYSGVGHMRMTGHIIVQ